MKKLTVICMIYIFCTFKTFAQWVEITPFAGYTFADKVDLYGGYGRVGDGLTYGIIIGKNINPHYTLEFLYSRQDAKGEYDAYNYYSGISIYDYDIPMLVSYFQLGGCRLQPLGASDKAEGFFGVNLGAAVFTFDELYNEKWMFAAGLKMGTKIWASDKVGIRLQANLQMPIQGAGVGIYAGTGGVSTGVSGYSTITQFGFTGGLIFRVGK